MVIFMELVKMDAFGRVMIPVRIRSSTGADKFTVRLENKEIILKPVPTWREMMGSIPEIDMDAYWREKKAEKEKERKEDERWIKYLSTPAAGSRCTKAKKKRKK